MTLVTFERGELGGSLILSVIALLIICPRKCYRYNSNSVRPLCRRTHLGPPPDPPSAGVLTSDPRIVANTRPVTRLTFEEATELAYFGAQVSVLPSSPPPRIVSLTADRAGVLRGAGVCPCPPPLLCPPAGLHWDSGWRAPPPSLM